MYVRFIAVVEDNIPPNCKMCTITVLVTAHFVPKHRGAEQGMVDGSWVKWVTKIGWVTWVTGH